MGYLKNFQQIAETNRSRAPIYSLALTCLTLIKVKTMNIEIDEKEYRDLLDIVHIADVVMSGHRRKDDTRTERHRALIQKLYALAKSAGLDRMIDFHENLHKYVPNPDFEKSTVAHVVLDEFGDHLFWDHLISRLSERDAAQLAGGIEQLKVMSESDRRHLAEAIRQRYVEEFSTNDIVNLKLVGEFRAAESTSIKTLD